MNSSTSRDYITIYTIKQTSIKRESGVINTVKVQGQKGNMECRVQQVLYIQKFIYTSYTRAVVTSIPSPGAACRRARSSAASRRRRESSDARRLLRWSSSDT